MHHLNLDPERPVLFLDIDGTLNGVWQHELSHHEALKDQRSRDGMGDWVSAYKCELLSKVLTILNAQVVIISSWVGSHLPYEDNSIRRVAAVLGYRDVMGSLETGGSAKRGWAVVEAAMYYNLKSWLVVDDSREFHTTDNIISPRGRYGLQDYDIEQIHRCLDPNVNTTRVSDEHMNNRIAFYRRALINKGGYSEQDLDALLKSASDESTQVSFLKYLFNVRIGA